MKKISFFALAIAGMLFTACSDKDLAAGEVGSQGEGLPDGYMSLSLNLPTTPTQRASNDNFDDGLNTEYMVNDCALLLFEGTANGTEDEARLLSAQSIVLPTGIPGQSEGNITTTYKATAKVENFNNNGTNKLYALALLNYREVMSIDNGFPTFKSVVKGGDGKLTKGSTMADLRKLVINANLTTHGGTTNYFFMTNAVLSKAIGGYATTAPTANDVVQLAEMDPTKIKEKMSEAEEDPAGEIFVERAVAKATLKVKNLGASTDDAANVNGLKIKSVRWTIDNREPSSFIVRNPGSSKVAEGATTSELAYVGYSSGYFAQQGAPYYRFVGNAKLYGGTTIGDPTGTEQVYRTYWGLDPQYDDTAEGMLPKYNEETGELEDALGYVSAGTTPLYCYENTFNVENQTYRNTTRAVIEVTLDDTQEFYTINNGPERYIDDVDEPQDGPKLTGEQKATSHVITYICNKSAVVNAFKEALRPTGVQWPVNEESVDVTFARDEVTGQYKVTEIAVSQKVIDEIAKNKNTEEENKSEYFDDDVTADQINDLIGAESIIEEVNKEYVVRQYKGGVMYYEARFKHFAGSTPNVTDPYADLAPWNVKNELNENYDPTVEGSKEYTYENNWEGKIQSGDVTKSYPEGKLDGYKDPEVNYLGRYGMVRNNWYDVEVTAFNKWGFPADPSGQVTNKDFDEPDTPDDSINDYISARIHVLSWAKRLQQWGFEF